MAHRPLWRGRLALRALGPLLLPAGKRGRLSIFSFHSVSKDEWGLGTIPPDELGSILEFVARYFVVLPLEEAVLRLQQDSLPSLSVAITFDDGYLDNAEAAVPISR